jgi:putative flippase GtrA
MKNFKLSRNLWLFAGLCFLLSFILNLASSKSIILPILNGITCILMFINAYIYHEKINKDNKN